MVGLDILTLAAAKNYSNVVGSTITGTSYDYDTSKLTFNTENGDWEVRVNNGMSAGYKQTLDNVSYNATDDKLEVNGKEVLTTENTESEDIDFSGFF